MRLLQLAILLPALAHTQTVFDATTNKPLPGVKISLLGSPKSVITDASGRFQLPTQSRPLPFRVEKPGYASLIVPPNVTTIRLSPESTLSGRIPNAPAAPVRVHMFNAETSLPVPTVLATNGNFHIPALPAGNYKLFAEVDTTPASNPRTYYPSALTRAEAHVIHLNSGEHKTGIELTLQKLPLLVFRGRYLGPVPATGNNFVQPLSAEQAMPLKAGRIEPDGTFYLQLFPGQYRLEAINQTPHQTVLGYLDVTIPATKSIQIPALTLHTVRAKLRWQNNPVPGQSQILLSPMEKHHRVQALLATPDGLATAKNIPPGRYSIFSQDLPPNAYIQSIHANGVDISQSGLDLQSDTNLEITLATDSATLTGRAPGASGVSAVPITPHPAIELRNTRHAFPDTNGNYTITALAPGEYKILAKPQPERTVQLKPNVHVKLN